MEGLEGAGRQVTTLLLPCLPAVFVEKSSGWHDQDAYDLMHVTA